MIVGDKMSDLTHENRRITDRIACEIIHWIPPLTVVMLCGSMAMIKETVLSLKRSVHRRRTSAPGTYVLERALASQTSMTSLI
jgi:hypothetical protein